MVARGVLNSFIEYMNSIGLNYHKATFAINQNRIMVYVYKNWTGPKIKSFNGYPVEWNINMGYPTAYNAL